MAEAPRPTPLETIDAVATEAQTGWWTAGANGEAAGAIRWTGSAADGEAMLQLANSGTGPGLSVQDGATLSGGTTVAGGITIQDGGAGITGDVGIAGALDVNGPALFDQTLHVVGASTFDAAVTANGTVTVKGNATLGDALGDLATINGGLAFRFQPADGAFKVAASHSATPDLVFTDVSGAEVFRIGDDNATWQVMTTGDAIVLGRFQVAGDTILAAGGPGQLLSFFGAAGAARGTVTGARGGNTALQSLITILENNGLVLNASSA